MVQPNQMATGGAGIPPQQSGGMPPEQPAVAPGAPPMGGDQEQLLQVLGQAIQQSIVGEGFVDLNKLAEIWPQVAQQAGLDVPFDTVLQMIETNPELLESIIQQMGLAGIVVDGTQITAQQLEKLAAEGPGAWQDKQEPEVPGTGVPAAGMAAGGAMPPEGGA